MRVDRCDLAIEDVGAGDLRLLIRRTVEWHLRKVFTKLGINSPRSSPPRCAPRPSSYPVDGRAALSGALTRNHYGRDRSRGAPA
jgi:hypothetical protein